MSFILEDEQDYLIWFIHQFDNKNFNRGAMKNIGFLAIKNKYPNDYKNITIIFNDVDTIPFNKIFSYETTQGNVKHYYGFDTSLGGIVVIKAEDFEKINGYPNYWSWSLEDACLQKRCQKAGLTIDRTQFYPIGSPEILQLFDGISRIVSKKNTERFKRDNGNDGIKTIYNLKYKIDTKSLNPNDNKYEVENNCIFIVNVSSFLTGVIFDSEEYYEYDLRNPIETIINPINEPTNKSSLSPDEWKNIPYNEANETLYEKQIQQQNFLSMKKQQAQIQRQLPPPPSYPQQQQYKQHSQQQYTHHQTQQSQVFINPAQNPQLKFRPANFPTQNLGIYDPLYNKKHVITSLNSNVSFGVKMSNSRLRR
jgi:Txe/YoeB family toxin of Txe-Axe toxin-antitoxin module